MKVLPFKRSSLPSDVPSLPHISVNLKLQYPLPTRPPGIRHLNCSVGQILIRCVLQTQNRSIDIGRDPFNQNFRKFRSKTQWIGSVQPEKVRKKWSTFRGGPLFSVRPVRSVRFSIPGPRCSVSSMYKMEENTYHCTFMDC